MTTKSFLTNLLIMSCIVLSYACTKAQADSKQAQNQIQDTSSSPSLTISFDFKRGGIASSQYAVWIEDAQGRLVRTLYATSFTTRGGYSYREDALPTWVEKSNLSQLTTQQVDAFTGATPKNGRLTYRWNGTDDNGKQLPSGTYRFYVEGTCYWQSRILYSGDVVWKGGAQPQIKVTQQRFHESDRNADMITNLQASYK